MKKYHEIKKIEVLRIFPEKFRTNELNDKFLKKNE